MTTQLDLVCVTQTQVQEELFDVAGGISGEIGIVLGSYLVQHVYPNKLGRVFNAQTDFDLPGVGKKQPDIAFVAYQTLAENTEDAVPVAPDLAVEVFSKTDTDYDMEKKVRLYQLARVKLVWVVHPISQTVDVYRLSSGLIAQKLGGADELDGENVIPGFKLAVNALFS